MDVSSVGINFRGEYFDVKELVRLPRFARHALANLLLMGEVGQIPAQQVEASVIATVHDQPGTPTLELVDLAVQASVLSAGVTHDLLESRDGPGERYYRIYPGEQYNLLTALARLLKPKVVFEYGTCLGLGSVALLQGMELDAKLYTVDIVPWNGFEGGRSWLAPEDFASGRVTQFVGDMSSAAFLESHRDALRHADLIFVDGPKDGITEKAFLANLAAVDFAGKPLVVFDDTRLLNMIDVWRAIDRPKMDLTSFGHWSGTGLVAW